MQARRVRPFVLWRALVLAVGVLATIALRLMRQPAPRQRDAATVALPPLQPLEGALPRRLAGGGLCRDAFPFVDEPPQVVASCGFALCESRRIEDSFPREEVAQCPGAFCGE